MYMPTSHYNPPPNPSMITMAKKIANNTGARISPYFTPDSTGIGSKSSPLTHTCFHIVIKQMSPENFSGHPIFRRIFQRVGLCTVSKAFMRSMKH